jgi:mannose-6-phosphate isomerase-like protein (cupin superfamily)
MTARELELLERFLGCPATLYKHANDAVFRVVLGGSIIFRDSELIPGDWMYVPAGQSDSFRAGRFGCVVMHTYH